MAYTKDLDNTHPSTEMPSSGDGSEHLGPVRTAPAKKPQPSDADHTRLEADETLPAIQMPASEDDQAGTKHVDAYPDVSMPGAFPVTGIEDVSQELKNGGLTKQQTSNVIEGLVKSSPFRNSVINEAFDMFYLPSTTPYPPPHLDPRTKETVKDKLLTTPPPKRVKTPGAPRGYKPTESPPAPKRRKVSRSKPVADLTVRIDNLENTRQDLNAVFQSFTQPPMTQPFSTFTRLPMLPQPLSIFTQQPNPQPSSPPTSSTNSCRLLSLPSELRNRIYRATLLSDRTIEIDKPRWSTHQSALLKTCRTIRAETFRLFYIENKISTNIHDWNPIVKYEFQKLMAKHRIRPTQLNHYFTGGPNWDNLMDWLQAVHQGRIGAISDAVGKQRPIERKTIGIMFKIVRKATGVSAWSQVEDLLVAHRELLGMNDSRWLPPPPADEEEVSAAAKQ
ncbi:hypothetical protein MBLNU13_g07752t1 [Cladosporium sp. NU13]